MGAKGRHAKALTPEQRRRIDQVLREALERPSEARRAFIEQNCGDDESVRAEALSLLGSCHAAEDERFLEEAAELPTLEVSLDASPSRPGTVADEIARRPVAPSRGPDTTPPEKKIGQYTVRRVVASGGMGTVYEAVQDHPRRVVALKVMKEGITSRSAWRRFEFESQILARLRHPGIAQVFESGTHESATGAVPYFVMEYIPNAHSITDYADRHHLHMRERLELFADVCDAVHHGHQKGIIHRDLKPGNILVDSNGQPKVIDFGVARATDSDLAITTLQTDVGQLIGTIQYMSPEQCEGDPHDLDTRSDIYALGIVLYELLCGKLPYDISRVRVYEAARVVREEIAPKLSTINARLRGDIETITAKSLEKDRERRYQSAGEFAQDIRRYLNNEPILARPPRLTYQLRMFARRNTLLVAAIGIVTLVLVAGIMGTTWGLVQANESRRDAERQADRATRTSRFLSEMLSMASPYASAGGPDTRVVELLDEAGRRLESSFADEPEIEAEIRHTVGITYRNVGNFVAAEEHLRRALELRIAVLGEKSRDTLLTKVNLGRVLTDQYRLVEAEQILRESLSDQSEVLGTESPDTVSTLNSLGWLLLLDDRPAEAEPMLVRALEVRTRVLGSESPEALKTMANLAATRIYQDKLEESEDLARTVADISPRVLGPRHPDTIYYKSIHAWWLWASGDLDAAIALYEPVLADARTVFGNRHHYTLYWMAETATLLMDLQDFGGAESLLLECLASSTAVFGATHERTLEVHQLLVDLYDAWNKPGKAAEWRAKLDARNGDTKSRGGTESHTGESDEDSAGNEQD